MELNVGARKNVNQITVLGIRIQNLWGYVPTQYSAVTGNQRGLLKERKLLEERNLIKENSRKLLKERNQVEECVNILISNPSKHNKSLNDLFIIISYSVNSFTIILFCSLS